MPLFSFKKSSQKQNAQEAVLRDKRNAVNRQTLATPSQDTGRRTSDTLQRESVKLMPALKPAYKPLEPRKQEIRLLRLHPGRDNDPIVCTSHHTSLAADQYLPYETVSYCWGRKPGEAVIELDRLPAQVTRSAARVLHRMRYPDKYRTLWVDAICINQEDEEEKSHQVAMMGKIYGKTMRNLVWLGEDGGYAGKVVAALEAVMANLRKETVNCYNLFYLTHTRGGNRDLLRDGTHLCAQTRKHLPVLQALFSSPWFGRLWVAQEVALAPTNLCHFGPATFSLNDVLRISVWLVHNTEQVPHALMGMAGFKQAMMLWYLVDHRFVPQDIFNSATSTLFSAWHFLQWMEASQPKDNVFALLGMVRSGKPTSANVLLMPDYTKSNVEVFRDATRAMIEERGSLAIFQHRAESNSISADMPSWVTHFDMKMHNHTGPQRLSYIYNAHDSCNVSASTLSQKYGMDVLSLRGIAVDRVSQRTTCMPNMFDSPVSNLIREALHLIYPGSRRPATWPREFTEKLAMTLIAGYNWLGRPAGTADIDDFVALLDYVGKHRENPPSVINAGMERYDEHSRRAMRCFSAIAIACSERRFFVTTDGRLGLGPRALANRDIIAVLYGGAVPFALRPVPNGRYKYVGVCYVSGIMNGEAMRQHKAGGNKDGVFHLV